jgi:hypothetical protein
MIGEKVSALPIFTGRPDIVECLLQIHIPSVFVYPPATTTRFSSYSLHNQKFDRKSRSAISELYAIYQAGRIVDEREISSEQIKYRNSIDVPAGTNFSLEQDLITKILSKATNQDYAPESIVASLKMNDVVHEFTVMDLEMVIGRFTPDQVHQLATNESTDRLELILKMFMQRYPYENSPY